MGEITNRTAPEPAFSGKWIAKLILAVILAEAIWAFIVSLTNSLILPALARLMGGDPQSPLYLGKGDFNLPAIFSSFLELCLAGIAAVLLNRWSGPRPVAVRVKTSKMGTVAAKASIPSISPTTVTPPPVSAPTSPPPTPPSSAVPPSLPTASPPPGPQPAPPAKPEKPQKRREVYYNIVGEPINPTEDD